MNKVTDVGLDVQGFSISPVHYNYTKVIIHLGQNGGGEDQVVEYGDDTGLVYEVTNPLINEPDPDNIKEQAEALAARILQRLNSGDAASFEYVPYKAESAMIDPAAEIGDGVSINDNYSAVYKADTTFGVEMATDLEAPQEAEVDEEFPYVSPTERKFTREIKTTKSQITQTAKEIRLEVAEQIEGVNSEIESTRSEISQTASSITQKVTSLANVTIQNLLPFPYVCGNTWTSSDGKVIATAKTDGSVSIRVKNGPIIDGEAVTIPLVNTSSKFKLSPGQYIFHGGNNSFGYRWGFGGAWKGWSTGKSVFNVNDDTAGDERIGQNFIFGIVVKVGTQNGKYLVKPMLERGDAESEWVSPVDSSVSALKQASSEFNIRADQIEAKVNTKLSTDQFEEEKSSILKQTGDAITAQVSTLSRATIQNLLPFPYSCFANGNVWTSANGYVVATLVSDGSISVQVKNGPIPSGQAVSILLTNVADSFPLSPGEYCFHGENNNIAYRWGIAGVEWRANNTGKTYVTIGDGEVGKNLVFGLYVKVGTQNGKYLVKPMLERGSAESEWVSPVDSTASVTQKHEAELKIQDQAISAKVSSTGGTSSSFGWTLTDSSWSLNSKNTQVFYADKDGVKVRGNAEFSGKIVSSSGQIGNFVLDTALHTANFSFATSNADGVYLGTDGLRLGKSFSVTRAGVLEAKSGTIGSFTLDTALHTADFSLKTTDKDGVYLGADGIRLGKTFKVTKEGVISASSGTIGKFTLGDALSTNGIKYSDTSKEGVFIGENGFNLGGKFKVDNQGNMTASAAKITGEVTATSGQIAAFKINTNEKRVVSNTLVVIDPGRYDTDKVSVYVAPGNKITFTVKETLTSNFDFVVKQGWTLNPGTYSGYTFCPTDKLRFRVGNYDSGEYANYSTEIINEAEGCREFKVNTKSTTVKVVLRIPSGTTAKTTINATFRLESGARRTENISSIYTDSKSSFDDDKSGVYLGQDGIAIGNKKFYVDRGGVMTASSGKIGAFDLTSSGLYTNGKSSFDSDISGVFLGDAGIALGNGAFKVTKAGVLTATKATIAGTIEADSGKIGGEEGYLEIGNNGENSWIRSKDYRYSSPSGDGVFVGTSGIALGKTFKVTKAGVLTASAANITGSVTAESGKIGGLSIDTYSRVKKGTNLLTPVPQTWESANKNVVVYVDNNGNIEINIKETLSSNVNLPNELFSVKKPLKAGNYLFYCNSTNFKATDSALDIISFVVNGTNKNVYVLESGDIGRALNIDSDVAEPTFHVRLLSGAKAGTYRLNSMRAQTNTSADATTYNSEVIPVLYSSRKKFSLAGNGVHIGTDGISLGSGFSVDETGYLNAKQGTIGKFTISGGGLYTESKTTFDADTSGLYLGSDGISLGKYFSVSRSGDIVAKKGTIGSFRLNSSLSFGTYTDKDSGETKDFGWSSPTRGSEDYPSVTGGYFGSYGIRLGNKFWVTSGGKLTVQDAEIKGTLKIGDDTITAEKLRVGAAAAYSGHGTWSATSSEWSDVKSSSGFKGLIKAQTIVATNELRAEKTFKYNGTTLSIKTVHTVDGHTYYLLGYGT